MSRILIIISLILFALGVSIHLYFIPKLRERYRKQIKECEEEYPKMAYQLEIECEGQEKAYLDFCTWIFIAALFCMGIGNGLASEDY